MTISINSVATSSAIFIALFTLVTLLWRSKKSTDYTSKNTTQELKGFAILAVIFAHIGYFLVDDHQFIFPLSVLGGVGVNIFLVLSGYGLTLSQLHKQESILRFYKRKLLGLFIPFWIVIATFLSLDYFVLHIEYGTTFMLKTFFGIFTSAQIYTDFNSPLWYLTFILGYYILFPILFSKKYPWLSAIGMYVSTSIILYFIKDLFSGVEELYRTHIFAFPIGMLVASIIHSSQNNSSLISNRVKNKIKETYNKYTYILQPAVMTLLISIFSYLAIHSGVGEGIKIEQTLSLLTVLTLVIIFVLKKYEYKVLSIFGLYSYEIYLFHWPIMYRYDVLYTSTPAWLATILYLIIFIGLGFLLKKISTQILGKF